jgi:hypothetical protein
VISIQGEAKAYQTFIAFAFSLIPLLLICHNIESREIDKYDFVC